MSSRLYPCADTVSDMLTDGQDRTETQARENRTCCTLADRKHLTISWAMQTDFLFQYFINLANDCFAFYEYKIGIPNQTKQIQQQYPQPTAVHEYMRANKNTLIKPNKKTLFAPVFRNA